MLARWRRTQRLCCTRCCLVSIPIAKIHMFVQYIIANITRSHDRQWLDVVAVRKYDLRQRFVVWLEERKKMQSKWDNDEKSYYLSWLQSRCLFLKIVIICMQPTAHQEHLHTRTHQHTQHITIFFFLFTSSFFHILCVFRCFFFFSSFFISFSLVVLMVLACIVRVCVVYAVRTYARTHALIPTHHRHNAQCSMHMHVALHSLILFPTNPQYHRSRWSYISSSNSGSNSLPMQPTTHIDVWCIAICESKWISGHWKTQWIYSFARSFVRWLVHTIFLPDFLQMPALCFSDSYNNTDVHIHIHIHKGSTFCTEAHCNPLQIRWFFML